jgi:hypothetical protein
MSQNHRSWRHQTTSTSHSNSYVPSFGRVDTPPNPSGAWNTNVAPLVNFPDNKSTVCIWTGCCGWVPFNWTPNGWHPHNGFPYGWFPSKWTPRGWASDTFPPNNFVPYRAYPIPPGVGPSPSPYMNAWQHPAPTYTPPAPSSSRFNTEWGQDAYTKPFRPQPIQRAPFFPPPTFSRSHEPNPDLESPQSIPTQRHRWYNERLPHPLPDRLLDRPLPLPGALRPLQGPLAGIGSPDALSPPTGIVRSWHDMQQSMGSFFQPPADSQSGTFSSYRPTTPDSSRSSQSGPIERLPPRYLPTQPPTEPSDSSSEPSCPSRSSSSLTAYSSHSMDPSVAPNCSETPPPLPKVTSPSLDGQPGDGENSASDTIPTSLQLPGAPSLADLLQLDKLDLEADEDAS